jgi:DNA processing protein
MNEDLITCIRLAGHRGDVHDFIKNKEKYFRISREEAISEIKKAEDLGIKIISFLCNEYPPLLKEIQDPPFVLYAKGNLSLLKRPGFAIIGARSALPESLRIAHDFARDISKFGFVVISGFAYGVDTAACKGSMQYGTIQILGSGINVVYPQDNTRLYNEVVNGSGLFLSEVPLDSPANPYNFPARNRLISGLSSGILLVQASRKNGKSGSLITAEIALGQNKDLFAIPGHPLEQRMSGCNDLIKRGDAAMVTEVRDILDQIGYRVKSKNIDLFTEELSEEVVIKQEIEGLTGRVLSLISLKPTSIESISENIDCNIRDIQSALSELEIEGLINRLPGGMFVKNLD